MRHQKQPYAGCFPTAVAMLYDVNVAEVIKAGLEGTRWTKWNEEFDKTRTHSTYSEIVTRILLKYPGPRSLAYNTSTNGVGIFPRNLPPNKGAVTITKLSANHVVAYEDQVIHDGNMDTGVSWDLWRSQHIYNGWRLIRIITMAEMTSTKQSSPAIQLKLNLNVC